MSSQIPRGMPTIGARIGRYQIEAVIGDGSMALVYRAIDRALERTVALKVLRQHAASDPESQQRFLDEARLTAKLSSHPNIIDVYDVGQAEGFLFLAMELHRGSTLAKLVEREGALPLPRAVHIIEQIAVALDFAHSQGIVHRDVKPGNVMIGADDVVTLTDFGLAKALSQSGGRTVVGTVMGTPNYMSPEQVRGVQVGPASDQYSLGITAYQVLSGVLPHDADSMATILYRQAHVELPVLRLAPSPSQSAPLDAVIRRATRKEPAARWPSIKSFAEALQRASRQRAVSNWRRIAPLVPLLLAGVVAALAFTGRVGRGKGSPRPTPSTSVGPTSIESATINRITPDASSSGVRAEVTDTAVPMAERGIDDGVPGLDPSRPSVLTRLPSPAVAAATDTMVAIATSRLVPAAPPTPRPLRRPTLTPTPTVGVEAPPVGVPTDVPEEPDEPDEPPRELPTNAPPPPPPAP